MTPTERKACDAVVREAMQLYRMMCEDNTRYEPKGPLWKACARLTSLKRKRKK